MKLLYDLYKTHSPSGKENKMMEFLRSELVNLEIDYDVDVYGQYYKLIPNTPLLCAHMDQISYTKYATEIKRDGSVVSGNGNLGADDKNGIWIILNLLKEFKGKISFLFTICEESGGQGCIEFTKKFSKELESIKYGLVFDRRGFNDVIGTYNEYCSNEFERDLKDIMFKYKYETAMGIFSDCDDLSDYISCINISCGYYQAHTSKEFTVIPDLINALKFGRSILKNITKSYSKPDKTYTYKWHNGWNNYHYLSGGMIDGDDDEQIDTLYFCRRCNEYYEYYDVYGQEKTCSICSTVVYPIEIIDYKDKTKYTEWIRCENCDASLLKGRKKCWNCHTIVNIGELKCGNCNDIILGEHEEKVFMLCDTCKQEEICEFCYDTLVEDRTVIYNNYKVCTDCYILSRKKGSVDKTLTVLDGIQLKTGVTEHYPSNVFDPYDKYIQQISPF